MNQVIQPGDRGLGAIRQAPDSRDIPLDLAGLPVQHEALPASVSERGDRMSVHGACDFVADAHNGAVVDRAWTDAAKADGIGQVRVALNCDSAGHVPWGLFAQGLAAWQASGILTDVLCGYEYMPPFTDARGALHSPNDPVGTGTHQLTSTYIEHFRLMLEAHARQLLSAGAGSFIIWNEPNINLVAAGGHGANRSSLAPEVYASLLWQSCHSLQHIGCTRRIAGALSVLPQTGLDAKNPYLLGYLGAVYAHLAACGVRPNWTHLALNAEGYWSQATAQHMHDTIRACMDRHGDSAPIIITEWGVENAGMDAARLLATGAALESVFGQATFFCRPGQTPYLDVASSYRGWGARQWLQDGTRFELATWYPIGDVMHEFWRT